MEYYGECALASEPTQCNVQVGDEDDDDGPAMLC